MDGDHRSSAKSGMHFPFLFMVKIQQVEGALTSGRSGTARSADCVMQKCPGAEL